MAFLNHHGVEHLISKIADRFASAEGAVYDEIYHGSTNNSCTLTPNTFHVWDEVEELNISLGEQIEGIANEYLFQFTSGTYSTALSIADDVKWANDEAPVIEANKIYQISILKGLGSVMSWSNSNLISFSVLWGISGTLNFECEKGMTWEEFVTSSYNTNSALKISNGNVWHGSYRIQDVTPTTIIENGKIYTSIYDD